MRPYTAADSAPVTSCAIRLIVVASMPQIDAARSGVQASARRRTSSTPGCVVLDARFETVELPNFKKGVLSAHIESRWPRWSDPG